MKSPSFILITILVTIGCVDNIPRPGDLQGCSEESDQYDEIRTPSSDGAALLTPGKLAPAKGVWVLDVRLEGYAFVLQEVPEQRPPGWMKATFEPEVPPGPTDVVLLGALNVDQPGPGTLLSPHLPFGAADIAPARGLAFDSSVIDGQTNKAADRDGQPRPNLLMGLYLSSTPGRLRLWVDWGGEGLHRIEPYTQGQVSVQDLGARPGVRIERTLEAAPLSLIFTKTNMTAHPAEQTLLVGAEQPDRIRQEGSWDGQVLRSWPSAAGHLAYPHPTIEVAAEYRGAGQTYRAVFVTAQLDVAEKIREERGLDFSGTLAVSAEAPRSPRC